MLGCPLLDALAHRYVDAPDGVVIELDITDELRGPGGSMHGGLLAGLADCAGAAAVTREAQRPVATSNVSLNYLAAARVGPLRASASALRVMRHHGVAQVDVRDTGKGDRLVATALVTVTFLEGEDYRRKTA